MKKVTVKLQEGLVIAETNPDAPVLPAELWSEIVRVGFKPAAMDILATGTVENGAFVLGGRRWPLSGAAPDDPGPRRVHLKVKDGGADPPEVEVMK